MRGGRYTVVSTAPFGLHRLFVILAAAAIPAMLSIADSHAANRFVVFGTGGVTGVYFPVGGAICRRVNAERQDHGIHCSVEATNGSVENVKRISEGSLDFGIVQTDVQSYAYSGEGPFEGAAFNKLRALFSLHSEPLTVVARADSGIQSLADLKGKSINIGSVGSGVMATFAGLMEKLGWTIEDFEETTQHSSREHAAALCGGEVDAIFFTVGHPNASIAEALQACDTHLVPIEGAAVDALVADRPYYAKVTIRAGTYAGQDKDVQTFGVAAVAVTSADQDEEAVYTVVKSVFSDLERFTEQHEALRDLNEQAMRREGIAIPLHPGAERYYREGPSE